MLDRRTLPLSALRAFESAAAHLHLGRAGEELGVTHGAISHQVRALEDRLQVKLFTRAHNRLALTPAGSRLYAAVKDGLDRILEGTHNIDPEALSGALTIGCTQTIASSWAAQHICEFRQHYPSLEIFIRDIAPRQKMIPQDIDVAICYGLPDAAGRRSVKLASPPLYPVASPAMMQGRVRPARAADIAGQTLLHDNQVSWDTWFTAHNINAPRTGGSIHFPNTSQALTAARLGYGVALCNTFETQEYIRSGQLIRLSEKSIDEEMSYYLLTQEHSEQSLKSKIFEDWIMGVCAPA